MQAPDDIKHILLGWLTTEQQRANLNKSRMVHSYTNAIKSLKQHQGKIRHPTELNDVKYFGEKLIKDMSKKFTAYCDEFGYEEPIVFAAGPDPMISPVEDVEDNNLSTKKRPAKRGSTDQPVKKRKKYIPAVNSGGYAILIALYLHDKHDGMCKEDIIKYAAPYSSNSFVSNPSTGSFYSAWSSVNTLIKNEYVIVDGSPKYYTLTDEGKEVAEALFKTSGRAVTDPGPLTTVREREVESVRVTKRKNPLMTSSSPMRESIGNTSSPFRGGLIKDLTRNTSQQNVIMSSPLRTVNDYTSNLTNRNRSEYQIWKPGSYKTMFVLDNREVFSRKERDLFSKVLNNMGIDIDVRSLPVGDGLWIAVNKKTGQECALDFIFERKRLDDLASSISDGRFREQKSRLERTGMNRIFYIVEEQMGSDISKFIDSIKTCIAMNSTYSKFHTKMTKHADETISLINDITNAVSKYYTGKSLLVLEPRNLNTQQQYSQLIETMRKNHTDKEVVYSYNTFASILGKTAVLRVKDIYLKLLMTCRGVSLDKAVAIQNKFPTPKLLIESFNEAHEAHRCGTLLCEKLSEETGTRCIKKALSAKIATIWCTKCNKIK